MYGANLSRGRRSDPIRACGDAIVQMAALGGALVTSLYVFIGLLVSKTLLLHMYAVDPFFLIVVGGLGASFGLWIRYKFRKYRDRPEAADSYRSKSAVRAINVLYIAVPIAWAWLIGFALQILDRPS
jgi:hypothetical protein